jgi:hypothetical protein
MKADPDGFTWLDALIPARDAAAEVIETASFGNAHGGETPICAANCEENRAD